MKTNASLGLLILAISANCYGQEVLTSQSGRARGFIGVTLGPSVPVGRFAKADNFKIGARPGAQVNLLNFGYRFSGNVGVALKWYGGANGVKFPDQYKSEENAFEPWSYGGLLVGPMISVPVSEKWEFGFKPMVGFATTTLPKQKNHTGRELEKGAIAFSFGATMQYQVARRFGLHFGVDYLRTSATFEQNRNLVYNISTLTPSVGLVVRLGLEQKAAERLAGQKAEAPEKGKDPNRRRGYVGVTAGPSVAVGKFAKASDHDISGGLGKHLNLLHFGYRFTPGFGMAVKGFLASNSAQKTGTSLSMPGDFDPWRYHGFLIGPLFTFQVSEKTQFNLTPQVGYSFSQFPKYESSYFANKSHGLAFGLGTNFQYNFARNFALQAGLDGFYTSAEFPYTLFVQRISTVTPMVGLVCRFR